jgi:anti-anti-sigma factor
MPVQHTLVRDPIGDAAPRVHDLVATLTDTSYGALAAVRNAQYASIAWARGRWLTGEAPTAAIVARLDGLQAALRGGPSLEALREQHVVSVPDTSSEQRWPMFAARAAELAVGSILSLPLMTRGECLGVLNLYATSANAFTRDDTHIASAFADRAAKALRRIETVVVDTQIHTAMSDLTHGLRVTIGRTGNTVVVRVRGVVDLHTAAGFSSALRTRWPVERQPSSMVVDLTGIRFMSVAGLSVLVALARRCRTQDVTLRLVATDRCVLRPMALTGLDRMFDIVPTLLAATRPRVAWAIRMHLYPNRRSEGPTTSLIVTSG